VVLENGAQVLAAAQSRLEISSSQQKARKVEDIHLLTGSVSLRVPKLTMQQGLTVTTPEAIVEVRGTAFVVTREAIEAGYVTRVSVSEGLVAVTAGGTELLLQPGDKWESPSTRGPSPALDHSGGKKHPHSTGSNKKTSLTASSLAEQNRLYQSAMHAKRNGLHELAKVRLRQLLASYPSSPLTPGVERELLKLDQVQTQ
jgi:TolA-binding protein